MIFGAKKKLETVVLPNPRAEEHGGHPEKGDQGETGKLVKALGLPADLFYRAALEAKTRLSARKHVKITTEGGFREAVARLQGFIMSEATEAEILGLLMIKLALRSMVLQKEAMRLLATDTPVALLDTFPHREIWPVDFNGPPVTVGSWIQCLKARHWTEILGATVTIDKGHVVAPQNASTQAMLVRVLAEEAGWSGFLELTEMSSWENRKLTSG
jgi:hypothetical protein